MSVFQNSNLPFSKINKELENNGYSVLNSALDKKLCDRYLKIVNSNLKKK